MRKYDLGVMASVNSLSIDQGLNLQSVWPVPELLHLPLEAYPKISVVSPNYNYAFTLDRTIHSVVDQKYPNLEYIVIDDGSTDESVDVIKSHSGDLAFWVHQKNSGQYTAINNGFEQANGEIMAWINSDDIYLPWTLHVVAEIFRQFPEIEWIIGRPTQIQNGVIRKVGPLQPYPRELIRSGLFRGDRLGWIQQESVFWRRSLWEKAGPLRTDLRFAADYELWTRFAEHAELVAASCVLSGFYVRKTNRHRENLKSYFSEMDQVVAEWPADRQRAFRKYWDRLQCYQRWKSYTGVRHVVRKVLRLEGHTGLVADWNTDTNVYDLQSAPFVAY